MEAMEAIVIWALLGIIGWAWYKKRKNKSIDYYNEGISYFNIEEYEKAIFSFNLSIKQWSWNYLAKYALATTYNKIKNYEKANIYFEESSKKIEEYELYNDWGLTLFELKEYDKANEKFLKAIGMNPNNYIVYFNYASCLKDMGNLEEAKRVFKIGLSLLPDEIIKEHHFRELILELEKRREEETWRKLFSILYINNIILNNKNRFEDKEEND